MMIGLKRTYTLNEDYFKEIDTEDKAYMLGFIYADGNIQKGKARLRITLKYDDIEILERFKLNLNYSGEIKVRELKSNQRDTRGYMIAELSVMGKTFIKHLNNKGVYPNKTFTIEYPDIPQHLDKHFIRGFFDGDGAIFERKDRPNGYVIELACASERFLAKVLNKLNIPLDRIKPKKSVYNLRLYKNKAKDLILDPIYKDSTIHLKRKYDLYRYFTQCPSKQ